MNRFSDPLDQARAAAHAAGEYAGQESFMGAGEIRLLAGRAGITAATSVLDLCCGSAGPGLLIARELGPIYFGVDRDPRSIEVARERARGLRCRFQVATVPPLPDGRFDVVLLLETMLAFADKRPLVAAIADALAPGGRFAFTLEEGAPLTDAERAQMPGADTVWPIPLDAMRHLLAAAGLDVRWQHDYTALHRDTAEALVRSYAEAAPAIAAEIGDAGLERLLASHRMWARWLAGGRIRKLAMVAEKGCS